MQLDKTLIAIRERSFLELLDLGLLVIRSHAAGWLSLAALGAVPFLFLNHWLVGEIPLFGGPSGELQDEVLYRYFTLQGMLLLVEGPLATAPLTLYLGQAMFLPRVDRRRLAQEFRRGLPQLLVGVVLFRAAMLAPLWLALRYPWLESLSVVCVFTLPWLAYRALTRPYVGEIVLLERNPWKHSPGQAVGVRKRIQSLHAGHGADLFIASLGMLVGGLILTFALLATFRFLRLAVVDPFRQDELLWTVYFPLSIWIVVAYAAVVRYLRYLDLRIRTEGWELELRLRAEGERAARQLA